MYQVITLQGGSPDLNLCWAEGLRHQSKMHIFEGSVTFQNIGNFSLFCNIILYVVDYFIIW